MPFYLIHPARLKEIAQLLKELSVDFGNIDDTLRQVIVNTHSPVLVSQVINTIPYLSATVPPNN